ncbi:sulfite exporter TauE/SafE family protein [uncultured Winogradskyella sp.]|uniref:sulfite exporter TauE/SafE family protein n=1 Tax=uncultured Winogradskyella sp. TaxID=395353 RepID=UPI0026095141|nr:sulfite exporter TauE/SafE family protein [uncultured Winogradskyella sp.]
MAILHLEVLLLFIIILVVVAFIYASVGHGGASGYLALMALFSFPVLAMKPTALTLNIFVSGIAFWFFKKNTYFRLRLFFPFAITSIPAAFLGGYFSVNANLYKQILGVFLIIAILRILNVFGSASKKTIPVNMTIALVIGGIIGLLSGMIGIGGGIILSPIIIMFYWGTVKEAAAVSALFIFVNSMAGIIGFLLNGGSIPNDVLYFIPAVMLGGALGGLYGSQKFSLKTLTYLLAIVLLLATFKLFLI